MTAELARRNLEKRLAPLRRIDLAPPASGWVRAMREALGMTAGQLAARLGVVGSRVIAIERAENHGSPTLKTMRATAAAMGCKFVYAFVPEQPLDETLRARANELANAALARADHTMRLENQALDADALAHERQRLIAAYLAASPRALWDDA